MVPPRKTIDVYLESGKKRVFAGALEWPGWCRSGKDEQSAMQALLDYAPRYAKVLRRIPLGFASPRDVSVFRVAEQLEGDATTDFGAPGKTPKFDARPVHRRELTRMQTLLVACWKGFDAAVKAASGKELQKGPRGGGRDLDKIVQHVLEADAGYLARIGTTYKVDGKAAQSDEVARVRRAILEALSSLAGSEPVRRGPRGGIRWTPRYYVRRSAWHVLDHAWEIEDRAITRQR